MLVDTFIEASRNQTRKIPRIPVAFYPEDVPSVASAGEAPSWTLNSTMWDRELPPPGNVSAAVDWFETMEATSATPGNVWRKRLAVEPETMLVSPGELKLFLPSRAYARNLADPSEMIMIHQGVESASTATIAHQDVPQLGVPIFKSWRKLAGGHARRSGDLPSLCERNWVPCHVDTSICSRLAPIRRRQANDAVRGSH